MPLRHHHHVEHVTDVDRLDDADQVADLDVHFYDLAVAHAAGRHVDVHVYLGDVADVDVDLHHHLLTGNPPRAGVTLRDAGGVERQAAALGAD